MTKTLYSMNWNLDNLYLEGSKSSQFHSHIKQLETLVIELEEKVSEHTNLLEIVEPILNQIGDISINLSQANSFLTCLIAQNPKDQKAITLRGHVSTITARYESTVKKLQNVILNTSKNEWDEALETKALSNYKFLLKEWRKKAETYLPGEEERLISDLMVDGYHAWGQLYNLTVGSIKVKVNIEGETKELSVGQTIQLRSHPSEEVRKTAHFALEEIWKEQEDLFALILNSIAGFRLQLYKKRGLENVLIEPLQENRLTEETLHSMWTAVSNYKETFINYLNKKAAMNGDSNMQSYNFWAPIGNSNKKIEYEDAVEFILKHFSFFGNELESFARQAFENGWIEAKNRPNKSAIAFCTNFPLSGESRIFMTYCERITNVLTLAHELGHAFHNYAMKPVDGLNRQYPLSIAETASTFSEQIILDAALNEAKSTEEKLFILDEKIKRSVMNFMHMHARFLFEKNFYEERKSGFVPSTRLNELMQESFDTAYEGSLENASLHSWVWTPHYYITKSPFYNFPYTFGYLFSLSLYAKSKEYGKEFEKKYIELLRDSGSMSTEELVMKHLNKDITSVDFWEKGIKLCVKDIEDFLTLISSE